MITRGTSFSVHYGVPESVNSDYYKEILICHYCLQVLRKRNTSLQKFENMRFLVKLVSDGVFRFEIKWIQLTSSLLNGSDLQSALNRHKFLLMDNPVGRPSEFDQDKCDRICEMLANGQSLRSICRDPEMPAAATVYKWQREHPEFLKQYMRACEDRADALFDEMFEIADDGANDTYKDEKGNERTDYDVISRSKLRVDTRKWALARMSPKKYGERIMSELSGPGGGPVQVTNDPSAIAEELHKRGLPTSLFDRE